jgi:transposase-like protein
MQRVDDVSGASLIPIVCAAVESGSEVHTDGWKGYNGLSEPGYRHRPINISSSGDPAHVSMPGVHRIAALLKRWLLGTHQGSVTAAHLDAYLNEFAFRFNRRHSRRRGVLFLRLLQHAVVTLPTRYRPSRSREKTGNHSLLGLPESSRYLS